MMRVYRGSDLDQIVDEMIDHMKTQIENPALLNSRFVFDEVLYLDVNFHQVNLTRGSFYFPLKTTYRSQLMFRSTKHDIFTIEVNKVALIKKMIKELFVKMEFQCWLEDIKI